MNLIKANLKSIIILGLVVLGLLVTIYLVKNPTIFKSRADSNKFQITGSNGNEAQFVDNQFTTTADHVTVGIREGAVENGLFNR